MCLLGTTQAGKIWTGQLSIVSGGSCISVVFGRTAMKGWTGCREWRRAMPAGLARMCGDKWIVDQERCLRRAMRREGEWHRWYDGRRRRHPDLDESSEQQTLCSIYAISSTFSLKRRDVLWRSVVFKLGGGPSRDNVGRRRDIGQGNRRVS